MTHVGHCRSKRRKDGPLHLYEPQTITDDCRGTRLFCGIYVKRYQQTGWSHVYNLKHQPHTRKCVKCQRFMILRMFTGEVFDVEE